MVIRVLVADDHAIVRRGLEELLATVDDIEVVGSAHDGLEAAALAQELTPDVVLMDLVMPNLDGVAATREISRSPEPGRVVVLTSMADDRHVNDALDAGAIGYVLKHASTEEIINAIRAAAAGDCPLDAKAARVVLGKRRHRVDRPLTPREEEVLRLVIAGMANKQIARHLHISERTVKAHLTTIFSRLGVAHRTGAALWARENLT